MPKIHGKKDIGGDGMKKLRELYDKTSDMWECMKISVECLSYAESKEAYYETIAPVKETVKDLIESMHNHLPELLDAWEMVQAVTEFTDAHRGDVVEVTQDVGYSWCISDLNKILKPYSGREAQKNEGVE